MGVASGFSRKDASAVHGQNWRGPVLDDHTPRTNATAREVEQ
jgi:hypothetical protein